jgi:hypothetical protein
MDDAVAADRNTAAASRRTTTNRPVAIAFYATNALARGMELASLSRELAARLADVTP